jgi:hypothetical protein
LPERKGERRMKMIGLAIGILFFLVAAVGCGPVYQIKYDYLAPESAEGRGCTQQCENSKFQCEEMVNKEFEQERLSLVQAYRTCRLSETSGARSPILCIDQSKTIQPDYSQCLADYKRCFQSCGGRVEERNVCIKNCK